MLPRKFRFGRTMFSAVETGAQWRDEVRRTESAGFSIVTVSDHFGSTGGVFSALQAAYDAAPGMRIGTLVLNNDFWHPSLLAREAITADLLSEGGFELGIGAGWDEPDYRAMGLTRRPPGERIDRLEESVRILRQAFAGERVEFHGKHHSVDAPSVWPRPAQGRIPVLLGGGSPRVLRFAGREADIVSIHRNLQGGVAGSWENEKRGRGEFADIVGDRVQWVREGAGDRFPDIELNAIVLKAIFTDHRTEAAADLGRANGLSADQVLASPHYLIGRPSEMAEDLERRRERWGISYWTLVGGDAAAFAAVIAKLAGS